VPEPRRTDVDPRSARDEDPFASGAPKRSGSARARRAAADRAPNQIPKPDFRPGNPARIKARMQSDRTFRESVVVWERRRNEMEMQLKQKPQVPTSQIADSKVALIKSWMQHMQNEAMWEVVCTLWEEPLVFSVQWDKVAAEHLKYTQEQQQLQQEQQEQQEQDTAAAVQFDQLARASPATDPVRLHAAMAVRPPSPHVALVQTMHEYFKFAHPLCNLRATY
jgi:hypothetical protein